MSHPEPGHFVLNSQAFTLSTTAPYQERQRGGKADRNKNKIEQELISQPQQEPHHNPPTKGGRNYEDGNRGQTGTAYCTIK